MKENKYLNEKKYKKAKKIISLIGIIILIIGLGIGGILIYNGITKQNTTKVDKLKYELERKKEELESKGIKYNSLAKYSDGETYNLKIITNALDPSFDYCNFNEYKNNTFTKAYCSTKNSTGKFATSSSIIFGTFICLATIIISTSILIFANERNILAFKIQQITPIAKEGIDEITPTIKNVTEEITKGIKKSLDNDKNK